ncbi:MAG: adenylate/guanylate cyclase domain-containing protein [Candidatus Methylacidiphilales bacterium]|nr:adenylate/guanylate cyclase domain-containing protein [Candidatus Methylacidiphilales bacterium]
MSHFAKKLLYGIFAPLIVTGLVWLFHDQAIFQRLENLTLDWRFNNFRAAAANNSDPDLFLIAIDQASIDKYGGWPWPRNTHGDLLYLLESQEPRVVAFDILFTDRRDEKRDRFLANSVREDQANKYFAESLKKSGRVILAAQAQTGAVQAPRRGRIDDGQTKPIGRVTGEVMDVPGVNSSDDVLLPMALLRYEALFGFTDTAPTRGNDTVRRTMPMVIRVGRQLYPSFVTQILLRQWNVDPAQVTVELGRSIQFPTAEGLRAVPINDRGEFLINYRPNLRIDQYPFGSLAQSLYDHTQLGKPLPSDFPKLAGRTVITGVTVAGLMNQADTPLSGATPPVLTHIQTLVNIHHNDFLREAALGAEIWGFLIVSWASLLGVRRERFLFTIGVPMLTLFAFSIASLVLFNYQNLILDYFWPVTGFIALHTGSLVLNWMEQLNSKQQLRSVFASYIAPSVLNQLLQSPDAIRLGGVRKPVTILFSDIRGFTTISESLPEEALVAQLNDYFEKMVGSVNRHQGTLHKFIGDAVMAVWGDVVSSSPVEDAQRAVRSALEMVTLAGELNSRWTAEGKPPFQIGIGLNFGEVVVGNIGATQRREFTVIGDAVNLASRIEGLTKHYRARVLVGESLAGMLEGAFILRSVGRMVVKGKTKSVGIYAVLAENGSEAAAEYSPSWLLRYEEAYRAFTGRDFEGAEKRFQDCLNQVPDDFLCTLYLNACRDYIAHPPPEDWDATVEMKEK